MSDFNLFEPGDMDDENAGRPLEEYEQYFNVLGLLNNRFGRAMGEEIYELLVNAAQAVSEQIDIPTTPGILFRPDEPGGEFVGFEMPDELDDDDYDPALDIFNDDPEFEDDDEEEDEYEEGF